MDKLNELSPLQRLGSRIEVVLKKMRWDQTLEERPVVVFDKETCCKLPTNAAHNTWWAYVAPAYHPCVTGFGKTLQEALQHLYDQLRLDPQKYTAVYDFHSQKNVMAKPTDPDTTMLGVKDFTLPQSLSSGPGNHTTFPGTLSSIQALHSRQVSQPVTTGTVSQAAPLPVEVTAQPTTQGNEDLITNSPSTTAARPATKMPILRITGVPNVYKPSINELMEKLEKLQKQVDTMSNTLPFSDPQANATTPAPSSTSFTLTPRASLGAKAAPHDDEAERDHRRSTAMSAANDWEMESRNVYGVLKGYNYRKPQSKVDVPKPPNLVSRTYPFGSVVAVPARTSASPRTNLPSLKPAHVIFTSGPVYDAALSLARHRSTTAFPVQQLQTRNHADYLPAAGVPTLISQSEHGKRKYDDTRYRNPGSDTKQQPQEKIKMGERFQTMKVEEQSPKKIKLEKHDEGPEFN